jgi:hypothetical protein
MLENSFDFRYKFIEIPVLTKKIGFFLWFSYADPAICGIAVDQSANVWIHVVWLKETIYPKIVNRLISLHNAYQIKMQSNIYANSKQNSKVRGSKISWHCFFYESDREEINVYIFDWFIKTCIVSIIQAFICIRSNLMIKCKWLNKHSIQIFW